MPELLTRSATADASSLDHEARTVDVVFATETPVRRSGWDGTYNEVLTISRSAIRADRLNGGLSVLDSHRSGSMANRVGSVVAGSFRIENGQAIATIKLSRKPAAEELMTDLVDGHTLPISVGYRVLQKSKTEARGDRIAEVRALRWEPLEISVCPVAADPNATTRGEGAMPEDEETIETGEGRSPLRTKTKRVAAAERSRIAEIDSLARRFKVEDQEFIDEFKTEGRSVQEFREAIIERRVLEEEANPTYTQVETLGLGDAGRTRNEAIADALYHRINPQHQLNEQARNFAGISLPQIARISLENNNIRPDGFSADSMVTRALHSTSDFPEILGNAVRRTLQERYRAVQSELKRLGRQTSAPNFKTKHSVQLSAGPRLERVNEHGEFTRGTFQESKESYKISTYGKVFGITRQALVNDDLGAFDRVPMDLARGAADLEADTLVELLESNPQMGDGKTLFHADHANLGAPAALSHDALSGARLAMRKQRGLAGELVDVQPKYLLIPLELQGTAEKIMAEIWPTKTEDSNPLRNRLEVVVDPRLTDATAWYLVGDPGAYIGLEYAFLDGNEGPQIFTRAGFDVDGLEIKVRTDFGSGFLDWRSWYMNPGAGPN